MLKNLLAALVLASPLIAATGARAQELLDASLIEALGAVEKPELGGVFSFVGAKNAPRAFADLMARDAKALKRYAAKLDEDIRKERGLTAWDHEVCATLVNHYAGGALIPGTKNPDSKRMKVLNACVLAPVVEFQDLVQRRKG